ncbi:hypothetical protein [Ancylobacter terrae]|uniref:hypothetical protein n=1 Tax=Ancylobacter sp. sgz301288 TaxID=3342077 RepID=UPI00385FF646
MTDATPTRALTSPVLFRLDFFGTPIRGTRHPVHGRLLMARDVVEAIGYQVKTYTTHVLNGLKVAHENRILLHREDFDTSGRKLVPTFDKAAFLTRAGLDQLVAGAAAKKVKSFSPWMVDVMENGVRPKTAKAVPEVPPEGLPWKE